MIKYTQGNILEADAEALVNTVNTVGVMGKGIALMFKEAYPANYQKYARACEEGNVRIGRMFVTETGDLFGPKYVINFPTKEHWRSPSRLEWIEAGLEDLVAVVRNRSIGSLAVPPLGAGNGGLEWATVRDLIVRVLGTLSDTEVVIYEPTAKYQNVSKRSGLTRLTPARALIVDMVRRYAAQGLECTILEVQKLGWFLERSVWHLGLTDPLGLKFQANKYGPYSDRLRHLLNGLDGSYLSASRRLADAGPLDLISYDARMAEKARDFLSYGDGARYADAVELAASVIDGFESPLALELLSTVDWLLVHSSNSERTVGFIEEGLKQWPGDAAARDRKRRLFTQRMIELALQRISETLPPPADPLRSGFLGDAAIADPRTVRQAP